MFDYFNSFWNWAYKFPEKVNPITIAVYFSILSIANRLNWKEKFAIIPSELQDMTGISSRTTLLKSLSILESEGFINVVSRTKNQYQNRVICLPLNEKHVKSTWKANEKHVESTSTHHKTSKDLLDPVDFKEGGVAPKFGTRVKAWFATCDKSEFTQRVLTYDQQFPKAFLNQFIDYYTQEHIEGGIHVNHEIKFDIESKLRKWWSDPSTREKFKSNLSARNRV